MDSIIIIIMLEVECCLHAYTFKEHSHKYDVVHERCTNTRDKKIFIWSLSIYEWDGWIAGWIAL